MSLAALLPWSTPVALALALGAIGVSFVREFRRDRHRDEQLHPEDVPTSYDVAQAQAIQDAPPFDQHASQACALTAPDDDRAILAAIEADLIRSRAVRRLARRLETTR